MNDNNPNYSSQDGVLFNKEKTEILHFPKAKAGDYVIPSSVTTTIDSYIFFDCTELTSIFIPTSFTTFDGVWSCPKLTSISIPSSVTELYGLFNCPMLNSVYVYAINPIEVLSKMAFEGIEQTCTLYVPKGSLNEYKNTTPWSWFTNIVEMEEESGILSPNLSGINCYIDANNNLQINGLSSNAQIVIYNISGQIMLNQNSVGSSPISVSALSKGIYTVKIITQQGNMVQKVLKK